MAAGDRNKNGVLLDLQEIADFLRSAGWPEQADRLVRDRWIVSGLMGELTKAHEIIRIALACLHDKWRLEFLDRVINAGLKGLFGVTRVNERNEVLKRARGEK